VTLAYSHDLGDDDLFRVAFAEEGCLVREANCPRHTLKIGLAVEVWVRLAERFTERERGHAWTRVLYYCTGYRFHWNESVRRGPLSRFVDQ